MSIAVPDLLSLRQSNNHAEQYWDTYHLLNVLSGGDILVLRVAIQTVTNAVGDIERKLEEDRKLSKESVLIKKVHEKKNVQCRFDPKGTKAPQSIPTKTRQSTAASVMGRR